VISKDFISPCLKTKDHWNSFNTPFLVTPDEVLQHLREYGKVMKNRNEELMKLQAYGLNCNSCSYKAKNIPDLRRHLLEHESKYS
jgi:aprataxin